MLCCDTARGTHSRRLAHILDAQIISTTDVISFLSRHFYYYSCVADEAGYLASVFIVSIPGIQKITSLMSTRIHISRDTHFTVTPRDGGRKKAEREENSLNVISVFHLCNYQRKASGERRGTECEGGPNVRSQDWPSM